MHKFLTVGEYLCYDVREQLPELCPETLYGRVFRGDDCIDITWRVYGGSYKFSICDLCK